MISSRAIKELSCEVETLRQEVGLLRSLLISVVGQDKEGEYRASIVKELLEAAAEPPLHEYSGPGSLVSQLKDGQ